MHEISVEHCNRYFMLIFYVVKLKEVIEHIIFIIISTQKERTFWHALIWMMTRQIMYFNSCQYSKF
jgi:hypothetical protein